ncbi:MAG: hypothetical protein ACRBBR_14175 [Cellvibrionaceae bacterium]
MNFSEAAAAFQRQIVGVWHLNSDNDSDIIANFLNEKQLELTYITGKLKQITHTYYTVIESISVEKPTDIVLAFTINYSPEKIVTYYNNRLESTDEKLDNSNIFTVIGINNNGNLCFPLPTVSQEGNNEDNRITDFSPHFLFRHDDPEKEKEPSNLSKILEGTWYTQFEHNQQSMEFKLVFTRDNHLSIIFTKHGRNRVIDTQYTINDNGKSWDSETGLIIDCHTKNQEGIFSIIKLTTDGQLYFPLPENSKIGCSVEKRINTFDHRFIFTKEQTH